MEELRLLPESGYRLFSDGYQLLWSIGSAGPRMWRADRFEGGEEQPLDTDHLCAQALPTGVLVSFGQGKPFLIGKPGKAVSVAEMLSDIEGHMFGKSANSELTRAQKMLDSASPRSNEIGFFGLQMTREPFADTCFSVNLRCF